MVRKTSLIGKFQAKIILITVIPMISLVIFNFVLFFALYSGLVNILSSPISIPIMIQNIQKSYIIVVGIIVLIFIGALFWVYVESGKMVGAFERLIRELNELDDDKQFKLLRTRKGDTFAKEIAHRINSILDHWAKGKIS